MAITRQQAQQLFDNYNNSSFSTAKEFVNYVFDLPTSADLNGFMPLTGGGFIGPVRYNNGGIQMSNLQPIDFYDTTNAVRFGFIYQESSATLFLISQGPVPQNMIIGGSGRTSLGRVGGNLGFFENNGVVRQTVPTTATATPTDLPSAIAEITILQNIVNSLRSGVIGYNLFEGV